MRRLDELVFFDSLSMRSASLDPLGDGLRLASLLVLGVLDNAEPARCRGLVVILAQHPHRAYSLGQLDEAVFGNHHRICRCPQLPCAERKQLAMDSQALSMTFEVELCQSLTLDRQGSSVNDLLK